MFQPLYDVIATTILIVSNLATGAYTPLKSITWFYKKPLATNLALYLAISTFGISFNL